MNVLEEHENICVVISLTLGEKERSDQEENCEQMARGSTEEETSLREKSLDQSNMLSDVQKPSSIWLTEEEFLLQNIQEIDVILVQLSPGF